MRSNSTHKNFKSTSSGKDEEPIRAELYSVERLEQFAAALASEHKLVALPKSFRRLLPRLEENGRALVTVYRSMADALRRERAISPAAEWLVDNFHIVEEQLREIREDLPRSYYRELPKLVRGEEAGYSRIYAIALALIAHTDSRLEADTMRRFIRAYQQETPLTIGELWALPITLRIALVENLRRLATRIVVARVEREEADALADKLLEMAGRQPVGLIPLLVERLGESESLAPAFVVQLAGRLREQDPALVPVFDWLETRLRRQDENIEQVAHLEHQRQSASQVTVGNVITSMRLLSTLDWRDFFESVSLVDPILEGDPAGVYAQMDFTTRDRYRHVIERIARRTRLDELEVARRAVELAVGARATGDLSDKRRAHVGYYLIDDGLAELERVFAEDRVNEADAFEEVAPVERREQAHRSDDVSDRDLRGGLPLVLKMHDLLDTLALPPEPLFQPVEGGHHRRVLLAQALRELHDESVTHLLLLPETLREQGNDSFGLPTGRLQQLVGERVRLFAFRARRDDVCRQSPQVLDERHAQGDRHGPQLADG